jgi:DnaJ-class molecular chaperone
MKCGCDSAAKLQELEERLKLLESTNVCPKCNGDGKTRWLSVGGGLNVGRCFKCDGSGRVKIK